jgi:hypothetical protein
MAISGTMSPVDDTGLLVFLAVHLGPDRTEQPQQPMDLAVSRGWLTGDGAITEAGRIVLRALAEQARTRSMFRPFIS